MRSISITSQIFLIMIAFLLVTPPSPASAETRVTVLYDAFGEANDMQKDWGFSALIEHDGQRILFDTGNDPDVLASNLATKGIDLESIDFAVISHRHGDHIGGLSHVLSQRPDLVVYTPRENFSVFGMEARSSFLEGEPSLPSHLRYFDGHLPEKLTFGGAWEGGDFRWIGETRKIAPGVHLIVEHGSWGVDLDVKEVSLALETEEGIVLVVGCSHPRLETIVEAAIVATGQPVDAVIGGFHLLPADDDDVRSLARRLRDEWDIHLVAPSHCTGESAIAILMDELGDRFAEAGVGATIVVRD